MPDNEKVLKLPDLLERQAKRIATALAKDTKVRAEWIEIQLEKADALAIARQQFPNDQNFGEWCRDNGFGENVLNRDDRAALIQFGGDLPQARIVLEATDRWSIQHISRNEWSRHVTKPLGTSTEEAFPGTRKPLFAAPKSTADREDAKEVIRAHRALHGSYPKVAEAMKASGKSRIVIEPALAAVVAEDRVAPVTHKNTKAQDSYIAAQIKVLNAAREAEFEARVQAKNKADIDKLFPDLTKLREDAIRTEKYHREQLEKKAIFTDAEFGDIRKACHPDNSATEEVRKRAFIALNAKKLQLTGKK